MTKLTIPVMCDFAINMRPFAGCFLSFGQVVGYAKVALSFSIPAIVCMVSYGAIHITVIRFMGIVIIAPPIQIKNVCCFTTCYFYGVNVLAWCLKKVYKKRCVTKYYQKKFQNFLYLTAKQSNIFFHTAI